MKVTITSFSYKRGLPEKKMAIGNIGIGNLLTMATFDMFDCRVMPNPYWDESLRGGMEFAHRNGIIYAPINGG